MYCPHCMHIIPNNTQSNICPICSGNLNIQNLIYQLPVGTILAGRYYLGKVIGQGGFGITYVGCDIKLNMKIAVKEYYPQGLVSRITKYSKELTVTVGEQQNIYEKQKKRFVYEARILAEFANDPYIVRVSDILAENNTIYIIMEYIDGITLGEYCRENGRMSFNDALSMLDPIMESLDAIHAKGLIHRDISPANIMITSQRRMAKLLDFGAVADYGTELTRSVSIILKEGYAPPEQYSSHGNRGPWSDVYALCATIYSMITGVIPENSIERMTRDAVKYPSEFGGQITPEQEAVLMCGLAVKVGQRFSSMKELQNGFHSAKKGIVPQCAKSFIRNRKDVASVKSTMSSANNYVQPPNYQAAVLTTVSDGGLDRREVLSSQQTSNKIREVAGRKKRVKWSIAGFLTIVTLIVLYLLFYEPKYKQQIAENTATEVAAQVTAATPLQEKNQVTDQTEEQVTPEEAEQVAPQTADQGSAEDQYINEDNGLVKYQDNGEVRLDSETIETSNYIHVRDVSASTVFKKYIADYVLDNDPTTAWFEGAEGVGIGEYLTFSVEGEQINGIEILPGYTKNSTVYTENAVPKLLLVESGKSKEVVDISNFSPDFENLTPGYYTFRKPILVENGTIKVMILSAKKGSKSEHTGISELHFVNKMDQMVGQTVDQTEEIAEPSAEESEESEVAGLEGMGGFPVAPLFFYTNLYCLKDGIQNVGYTPLGYYFFTHATGKDDINACIGSEPETIDPGLVSSYDESTYTQHLFEGLMKYVSNGEMAGKDPSMMMTKVDYGMAENFEVSEDQLTYTFTLRDAIWSDGEPVKAGDFVYSWRRIVDPATDSDYGYILDGIVVNATAIQAGEAAPEDLGIVALDDKTLKITLEAPCPYFVELCASASLMPLRQDVIEAFGTEWTNPENIVNNGPFIITKWAHDSYIRMGRNAAYYDVENLGPKTITYYLVDSLTAMLSGYKSGEFDFLDDFPTDRIAELQASGDCYINDYVGTYYIYLSCDNIPDWRVRAAIDLVIDRENIVDNVAQGGEVPATGLVAAGIGDSQGDNFATVSADPIAPMWAWLQEKYGEKNDLDLNDYEDRVKLAKMLVEEAVSDGYDTTSTIYYRYNTSQTHQAIAEAVQEDVKSNLGLNLELYNKDWDGYVNDLFDGDFGVARLGWISDYNDPIIYLELFTNGNSYNYGNWVCDEFTDLINQAKNLPAGKERDVLLYQAEKVMFMGAN